MSEVEAFARCRTPAEFYRLQIEIENRYLPSDIATLISRKEEFPPRLRKWLTTLGAMMRTPSGAIEPFVRTQLGAHVWYLRGGGSDASQRLLVVAFGGNSMRLMLPLCAFVQRIPAARCDLVVVNDPAKACYLRGVKGYAPDLRSLVERLASQVQAARYASIRCIGTSAGGAAALCAARLLGAARAIAIGSAHPARLAEQLAPLGLDGHEFDQVCASFAPSAAEVACVFGADNARDREGALSLLKIFPAARQVALGNIASHNVLFELLRRGALGRFLRATLLDVPGTPAPADLVAAVE